MQFRSLPWQLTWVVFAVATGAQIVAVNETDTVTLAESVIKLQRSPAGGVPPFQDISNLLPLTDRAELKDAKAPLSGNLFNTNPDTVNDISALDIAYISCNPADYPEGTDAFKTFNLTMETNITAIIFYNTVSDYCKYLNASDVLNTFPIYSMMSTEDSSLVLDTIDSLPISDKFFVQISRLSDEGDENEDQKRLLQPSPTTAVAMIILYSITGIITALFLVIIITGAVRAHRHPDRYGPRDILGRPRQSRARGLGRAILDTIPIVKFGEREPPKSTDAELGPTATVTDVDNANSPAKTETGPSQNGQSETGETGTINETEVQRDVGAQQQSGIAPAQPLAIAAATRESSAHDDHLGCSICTEDFEKGQDIRVLPCDHKFHPECVDPWLLNVSGTCPLCRVDLRPVTSRTSDEEDPDGLAAPLQQETDPSYRRRSALRGILLLRSRPNASAEERISALRRLREQRRNLSDRDVTSPVANRSTEDIAAVRRSRRMSARLSDVFSSRTRRHGHDETAPATPTAPSAEMRAFTGTADEREVGRDEQRRS